MSAKAFDKQAKFKLLLVGLGTLALTGCDDAGGFAFPSFGGDDTETTDTMTPGSTAAVSLVERDVEAPEVFEVNETGLWDGRPSLGGVWVAHPEVVDPERVIIRNETNGSSVIGALFRRERENPGPALQVSSDAAEELGVLAGAPTILKVTALRREEGPSEAEVAAAFEAPAPVQATALDAPAETEATGTAGGVVAAMTAAPTAPAAATSDLALTGAAAIAIAAAEAAGPAADPTPAVATTPIAAPAPAPAPQSSLDKPYIQIGIFSVEDNARRTASMLAADGLLGTVLAQESQGNAFWRVIVGPSPNADDRAAVLAKVKALGFEDAYFVTN